MSRWALLMMAGMLAACCFGRPPGQITRFTGSVDFTATDIYRPWHCGPGGDFAAELRAYDTDRLNPGNAEMVFATASAAGRLHVLHYARHRLPEASYARMRAALLADERMVPIQSGCLVLAGMPASSHVQGIDEDRDPWPEYPGR